MSLAARIARSQVGPVDLAVLQTGVQDVVTIRGSLDTWPDLQSREDLVQDWMADTLDKGTLHRDRFVIADELEGLGVGNFGWMFVGNHSHEFGNVITVELSHNGNALIGSIGFG